MIIKAFKNGNFNVKAENNSEVELLADLCNSHELDFQIAGEEGCASNYDMYYQLYNSYTGLLYLPTGQDCRNYADGLTVKLVGRALSVEELQELENEGIL